MLLLLLGLLLLLWWILQLFMSSPLKPVGSELHDFGVVLIDPPKTTVEHTFVIENTSSRPVRILKTVPSCGCTWAGPGEPYLEPGQRMELPVTFTVKESHKLDSNIKVVLEDESPLVLWLSANGRMRDTLRHTPRDILIRERRVGTLGTKQSNARLYVEGWDNQRPPEPAFEPPDGLEVDFHGWRMTKSGREKLGTPDMYQGTLLVTATGDPPSNASIPVRLPDGQETILLINAGKPIRAQIPFETVTEPGTPEFEFKPEQIPTPESPDTAEPPQSPGSD